MANLTLSIDDDVLRRARIRALEGGTSVNAVVREYLADFAGAGTGRQVLRELVALAEASDAASDPTGRTWSRDETHDR